MAIVKSRLLQKIYKKYPNFYKKDLEKFFNIILEEIKYSLKKGERVELRGFGIWSTRNQKSRISRIRLYTFPILNKIDLQQIRCPVIFLSVII